MSWRQLFSTLDLIPSTFLLPVPNSRNSILNWVFKIISFDFFFSWSFNNYFLHAFAMKKFLEQWSLGITWCSNCCNCFIVTITFVCYIQVKNQMWHDIFSRLQSFLLADALPLLIFFSRECYWLVYTSRSASSN